VQKLTLMNRTHRVCDLGYDEATHRFSDILSVYDNALRAPIGLFADETTAVQRLNDWWEKRTIPEARPGLFEALSVLGVSAPLELLEKNHGLSLSDQYWIKDTGSSLAWEEINYFNNPFSDDVGRLFFGGKAASRYPDLNSPDNSSDGNLPKRWIVRNGKRILLKAGGLLNQEPYNEVIAAELYSRLVSPEEYVAYWLFEDDQHTYSACENMLSDREEYVPALFVQRLLPYDERPDSEASFDHFVKCCELLGIADASKRLSKMLAFDYLLANHDRHLRNFGLIRNVDDLTWRVAPLFDSGSSLWCDKIPLKADSLNYVSQPFVHDPGLQLLLIKDFSWFDPEKLYGFVDFAIATLQNGPLDTYSMRLNIIEDALYERLDRLIDRRMASSTSR
jgi:hypothetical protein